MTTQRRTLQGLGNRVLVLMLLWTAIPFYWMIAMSLKHDKEIYGYEATLIPQRPTVDNYVTVFRTTPYLLYLRNSMAVAVGSTLLSMVIAVLGAYAIARLNFPGRALLARGLVFTYLVPTSLLFIPMFAMMSVLRLTDSLHGLIIAYLGFDVPFCTFTHAWNEFLYAHVFTSTTGARTVTTGLVNFMSQDVFFWGPLMASTVMSALPPVLMFLLFQRWVVKGLTLGGVKG